MSISNLLTETVEVQQVSTSQNDMGGINKTYSTRISSMPCTINAKTLNETDSNGKITAYNVFKVYAEYNSANSALTVSDRLVWGSRYLEVVGIYNASQKDRLLHINCYELD